MGIKGLETFAKENSKVPTANLTEQLRGKTIVVDFPALEFYIKETLDLEGWDFDAIDGESDRYELELYKFSEKLSNFGVKQLWVKDGYLNPMKMETQRQRGLAANIPEFRFNSKIISLFGESSNDDHLNNKSFKEVYDTELKHTLKKDQVASYKLMVK